MVACEHCEGQVFERLCQMACHVIKNMGLQSLPHGSKKALSEMDAERTNLFWTVFIMDKERVFMTGQPCNIYVFDSDVQLLRREPGLTLQHYTTALFHMMCLWEDIYISLYSSKAFRKGQSYRHSQISRLNSLFRTWGYQHKNLLNIPTSPVASIKDHIQLELKYSFHVGQILVHRCGSGDSSKQQRISSEYAALNIIKDVHGASPSVGSAALLGRSASTT